LLPANDPVGTPKTQPVFPRLGHITVCPACAVPQEASVQQTGVVPETGWLVVATPLSSLQIVSSGMMLAAEDKAEARLALFFAELRLTSTIDAKMPMMAMTIKSSIRVKPLFFFLVFVFFIFTPAFLFLKKFITNFLF